MSILNYSYGIVKTVKADVDVRVEVTLEDILDKMNDREIQKAINIMKEKLLPESIDNPEPGELSLEGAYKLTHFYKVMSHYTLGEVEEKLP